MSTNLNSAKQWLADTQPSQNQIQDMVEKLERRIENWQGEPEQIQGSIEAADFLQNHLSNLTQPVDSDSSQLYSLDSSPLIPEGSPAKLNQDVKTQTFNTLKKQFGLTLPKNTP